MWVMKKVDNLLKPFVENRILWYCWMRLKKRIQFNIHCLQVLDEGRLTDNKDVLPTSNYHYDI
jgi:hypothetical protein